MHYSVSKEEKVTQILSLKWLRKAGDDGMAMVLQINHSYLSFPKKSYFLGKNVNLIKHQME